MRGKQSGYTYDMLSALKCICGGTGNPGGRLRTSAANQPDQTRPHLAKTTTVTEQTILKTPAQLPPVREVVNKILGWRSESDRMGHRHIFLTLFKR